MLRDVTWELHADRALLRCGSLRAAIDVKQTARGLHDLSLHERPLVGCEFLGAAIDAEGLGAVADCYQRGGDLIVRYAQTADRPFAVEVYWRAGLIAIATVRHPYVDLVVSVQTNLLDSRPELETQTCLATAAGEWAWTRSTHNFVADFPPFAVSYVEMVHPDDALVPALTNTPAGIRLATRLFGQPLEKGVILRSRLRGAFVPMGDRMIAAEVFSQFAAAPPPLTT